MGKPGKGQKKKKKKKSPPPAITEDKVDLHLALMQEAKISAQISETPSVPTEVDELDKMDNILKTLNKVHDTLGPLVTFTVAVRQILDDMFSNQQILKTQIQALFRTIDRLQAQVDEAARVSQLDQLDEELGVASGGLF